MELLQSGPIELSLGPIFAFHMWKGEPHGLLSKL